MIFEQMNIDAINFELVNIDRRQGLQVSRKIMTTDTGSYFMYKDFADSFPHIKPRIIKKILHVLYIHRKLKGRFELFHTECNHIIYTKADIAYIINTIKTGAIDCMVCAKQTVGDHYIVSSYRHLLGEEIKEVAEY